MSNPVAATQNDRVSTQASDDRIEDIWDGIVDMIKDYVSGPIPLSGDHHPQLDETEQQKLSEALESFDISELRNRSASVDNDGSGNKTNPASGAGDSEVEAQGGIPTRFPVEPCFSLGIAKVCGNSGYPEFGKPRCHVWTPKLWYYTFSVNSLSRDFGGGFSIDATAENLWLGVDKEGCIWAGEETSGSCAKITCNNNKINYNADPVSDVAASAVHNALEAADEALDELKEKLNGWKYYIAIAIIALCLVILVIKTIPLSFLVGGALLISTPYAA